MILVDVTDLSDPLTDFQIVWYNLTAYIPRLLPRNNEEYDFFLKVCFEAYGVPDSPQARATLAAQVGGVPGYRLRKAWGHLANQAKRLTVNKIAQEYKIRALSELQKQLEDQMKENVKAGGPLEDPKTEEVKEFINDV